MKYKVNTRQGLRIMAGPGTDYEVVDWVMDGTVINGIDDLPWLPFIYYGDEGSVSVRWIATRNLVEVEGEGT